jgi:hypothetical protein
MFNFCKVELTWRRARTTIKKEEEKEKPQKMLQKKPVELFSTPREG